METNVINNTETYSFGADATKVLNLVIHSLYTRKDVFLRELISNASDALEKLKQESLVNQDLLGSEPDLSISIKFDKDKKILEIIDNGIGMNKPELIKNLGTVGESGTQKLIEALKDKKVDLIGQFGVGFYSVFMVADKVEVITKKAGEEIGYTWVSHGKDNFYIEENKDAKRGTTIKLHIKTDEEEFLDKFRIEHLVTSYSNHITFPINFINDNDEKEQLNSSSAIWTKDKTSITPEEHQTFFRDVAHVGGAPWMVIHNKNEGKIEYINLLYIPSIKPFDLYNPDRRTSIKLYIKKVFITEENVEIIPRYLRFIRGVVDCADLPLNISRETLQYNNTLTKIKKSLTNKVINELEKKSQSESEKYTTEFWPNFGAVLKEGLCEPMPTDEREKLLGICRFYSMNQEKLITIDDYINNMQPEQKDIFYLCGTNIESIKNSPQLEGFTSRGLDVLLFIDPVDDFWTNVIGEYKNHHIKSVTRSNINLEDFSKKDEEDDSTQEVQKYDDKTIDSLIKYMQEILKNDVESVIISKKLTDSPVCLAVAEGAMDMRMERFMMEQNQLHSKSKKILEINTKHPIIGKLIILGENDSAKDLIHLLFDQACIIEGENIKNPMNFSKLMNKVILEGLQHET
jgi:molecular chaperone HtpG